MKVLVTGGSGFIGTYLRKYLENKGCEAENYDLKEGSDILDWKKLNARMKNVDTVYHLAAIIDPVANVKELYKTNATGTFYVLRAAQKNKVNKFTFTSTAAVYGNAAVPVSTDAESEPISNYGWSKRDAEIGINVLSQTNPETLVLRLFNVYGPGQEPSSPYSGVISKFISRALKNEPLEIYGDGTQTRDFIYVEDVVRILVELTENISGCSAMNLGRGVEISINDLAKKIISLTDSESEIVHVAARDWEIKHSCANMDLTHQILDRLGIEQPRNNLEMGLEKTIEWFAKKGL